MVKQWYHGMKNYYNIDKGDDVGNGDMMSW